MAHHTIKSSYKQLVARLNRFPQGAPPSALLFKILEMLFSEREAALVAMLPIRPFGVDKAARIWKMKTGVAQKILVTLAGRGILVDIEQNGKSCYVLPPPMAGFFEFSLMRVHDAIDQKLLSELFYQYLNVEEDFIKMLFTQGETQLGRTFVNEPVLSSENALHVLDYERVTAAIHEASHIAVGTCYCRHKMVHVNRACKAPLNICMTFNQTGASLIKHHIARQIDRREGLDLLQTAYQNNLVQFGENVRKQVNFICNCCGCCCEAMLAARRFANYHPIHTTNFIPVVDQSGCNGCGKCVNACPVEAMMLVSANHPRQLNKKRARVNEDICLGCGICVQVCGDKWIRLASRAKRVITPLNGAHRAVVMAIERGTLQDLIFDNRVLWSHRALAAVLGVILKLPPVKRTLAGRQVKSRYLEALIERMGV